MKSTPTKLNKRQDEQTDGCKERGVHKGYLETIGHLGDDGALGEETKERFADRVWQREHEDAKRDHLRRISMRRLSGDSTYLCGEKEKRERVAVAGVSAVACRSGALTRWSWWMSFVSKVRSEPTWSARRDVTLALIT